MPRGRAAQVRPFGGRSRRAAGVRTQSHHGHGLPDLLPRRLGLRPLREGAGHPRRAGPRQRGGQHRRLLPRHHDGRPARARPALRALPQPLPHLDAGHRHRLRGRPARRDHQVRDGEVRRGAGLADHHLRDAGGAGGDPRCRPRARYAVRRRGSGRETDPAGARAPRLDRASPRSGAGPEGAARPGREHQAAARHRAEAGGRLAPRLDARGGHRHLARSAHPACAVAARGHRRQRGRDDAVPDGLAGGTRPPEDGLPRPEDAHGAHQSAHTCSNGAASPSISTRSIWKTRRRTRP